MKSFDTPPSKLTYAADDVQLNSSLHERISRLRLPRRIENKLAKLSRNQYGARDDLMRALMRNHYGISIGKYTYGYKQICKKNAMVFEIGAFSSLGPGLTISRGNHPTNLISTSPALYLSGWGFTEIDHVSAALRNEPVVIGHDVWIGMNVSLMSGITIGHGSVVAGGAVVTKDVPPYSIIGGVPAKVIRYRFDDETIAKVLASEWWLWKDERIRSNQACFLNPVEFVRSI